MDYSYVQSVSPAAAASAISPYVVGQVTVIVPLCVKEGVEHLVALTEYKLVKIAICTGTPAFVQATGLYSQVN